MMWHSVRRIQVLASAFLLIAGCGPGQWPGTAGVRRAKPTTSLADARRDFKSKLAPADGDREPLPDPPPQVFHRVRYKSPVGELAAYLTTDPRDGERHPAIVWITGGDCNSVGDVWSEAPASNDQTASAYRKAGIVMMFPSLRGGNDNPGRKEGFLGEVDDVLAAADYLAERAYVDPKRIYLGGHSTGGTLALLVAESSDRFRAVFSFGPVDDVGGYGPEYLPFNHADPAEIEVRSPGRWLHSIRSPAYVFEGTKQQGNLASLQAMAGASSDPRLHFHPVKGADHFTILSPTNALVAGKILRDVGPTVDIAFTEDELTRPFRD